MIYAPILLRYGDEVRPWLDERGTPQEVPVDQPFGGSVVEMVDPRIPRVDRAAQFAAWLDGALPESTPYRHPYVTVRLELYQDMNPGYPSKPFGVYVERGVGDAEALAAVRQHLWWMARRGDGGRLRREGRG